MDNQVLQIQNFTAEQFRTFIIQTLKELFSGGVVTNTTPTEIISESELCKRLNISRTTALTWSKKKKIPRLKIGKQTRYDWNAVIKALEEKR